MQAAQFNYTFMKQLSIEGGTGAPDPDGAILIFLLEIALPSLLDLNYPIVRVGQIFSQTYDRLGVVVEYTMYNVLQTGALGAQWHIIFAKLGPGRRIGCYMKAEGASLLLNLLLRVLHGVIRRSEERRALWFPE